MEIERRFFKIEYREDGEQKKPHIEGYAAVFNSKSEDLGGWREEMEPGFFDDVMNDDVRALFNHDRNFVLGRKPAGTLEMEQDLSGLKVRIDPPSTDLIRDLVLEPMRRGDINQMSFAFTTKPNGYDWRDDNGELVRVLKKGGALRLYDVSIVTEPAYPETTAQVRSMISEFQAVTDVPGQEPEVHEVDPQEQVRSMRRRLLLAG